MRNTAFDYLRAFITVLVVAHHAVLAYHPYAPPLGPFDATNVIWAAFPIVDAQRWVGSDWFVGFNDTYFMALMFLVSGLFVWPALQRKGAATFLRERIWRLGVPFVFAVALLAPLAYAPAWLQRGGSGGVNAFVQAWLALGVWPAGPAWFLWLLLAFNTLAACAFRLAPRWAAAAGAAIAGGSSARLALWLAAIALLTFVPLASAVDPSAWAHLGPLYVQTARVLLYAGFFAVGCALGAFGLARGALGVDGCLARRWLLWPTLATLAYLLLVALFLTLLVTEREHGAAPALTTATLAAFALTCSAASLALLSLFLRFAQRRNAAFDSLARNAYGIYLFHYAAVSWLQYALLRLDWPGALKGTLVFVAALGLSWLLVAALRRLPVVARMI